MNDQRSTSEWQALDAAHHLHPFTDPKALAERGALIVERGEGSHVFDTDGRRILDGMAGLWCVNVGYGRSELAEVAARQMERLPYYNTFFQSATPTQLTLAERLSQVTPDGIDHFFFTNSGSEANDTIVRLVRHYWRVRGEPQRRTIIARNLGYHGSTLAAAAMGGMAAMHAMCGADLPDFERISEPHFYRHGGNMDEAQYALAAAQELEDKIAELGAERIAAFIAEPVQGAGGVIAPPPGYWPEIERICRAHGILLIVDEVICGFGRLGEWFGCDHYGVRPDFITMAKGLSSGYLPIAGVGIHDDIYATLYDGGPIPHGFTYSGHPVACAVAERNIDIIEREGLVERTRLETAPYFRAALQDLADAHPIVGEFRGEGLLGALQLVRDPASKTFFEPAEQAAIYCRDQCLEHGVIMRAVGDSMVICPPLVITRDEIDELVAKAKRGLDDTSRHFGLA